VHQARNEDVVGQDHAWVVAESPCGVSLGENAFDAPVAHSDRVALEHRARGLDRDDPARLNQEAVGYLGMPFISTTTRRFGVRHSMSALRSFWSGQPFTGLVLPEPRVSILEPSNPLDTR